MYVFSLNSDTSECESQFFPLVARNGGAEIPVGKWDVGAEEARGLARPAGGGISRGKLSRCAWPHLLAQGLAEGAPSCAGKGRGGALQQTPMTHVSYYMQHSLWEPQWKTHMANHPFLKRRGPQERGFWLLALSRVRNKVKALSLLEKQTVLGLFMWRLRRQSGYQQRPEEPTWVSKQWWKESIGIWPLTPAPWQPQWFPCCVALGNPPPG